MPHTPRSALGNNPTVSLERSLRLESCRRSWFVLIRQTMVCYPRAGRRRNLAGRLGQRRTNRHRSPATEKRTGLFFYSKAVLKSGLECLNKSVPFSWSGRSKSRNGCSGACSNAKIAVPASIRHPRWTEWTSSNSSNRLAVNLPIARRITRKGDRFIFPTPELPWRSGLECSNKSVPLLLLVARP